MTQIEKITNELEVRNIKQKDFCESLNIMPTTFSTWKKKYPNIPNKYITPICNYFGWPENEFIELEIDMSNDLINSIESTTNSTDNPVLDAYKLLNAKYHSVETETCVLFHELPMEDKLEVMVDIVNRTKKYSGDE